MNLSRLLLLIFTFLSMGGEAVVSGYGIVQDARDQTHECSMPTESLESLEEDEKDAHAGFGTCLTLEAFPRAPLPAFCGRWQLRAGVQGFPPCGAVRWHRWLGVDLS